MNYIPMFVASCATLMFIGCSGSDCRNNPAPEDILTQFDSVELRYNIDNVDFKNGSSGELVGD